MPAADAQPVDPLSELQTRLNKHIQLFNVKVVESFNLDHLPSQGQSQHQAIQTYASQIKQSLSDLTGLLEAQVPTSAFLDMRQCDIEEELKQAELENQASIAQFDAVQQEALQLKT